MSRTWSPRWIIAEPVAWCVESERSLGRRERVTTGRDGFGQAAPAAEGWSQSACSNDTRRSAVAGVSGRMLNRLPVKPLLLRSER